VPKLARTESTPNANPGTTEVVVNKIIFGKLGEADDGQRINRPRTGSMRAENRGSGRGGKAETRGVKCNRDGKR